MMNRRRNLLIRNQPGRAPLTSTVPPICVTDSFKPVGLDQYRGAELLLCLDIVRGLDITAKFGIDHFRAGQGELDMVTYNEKHLRAFPLVPTSCSYSKLGEYFGELRKSQIAALQAHGDFGASFGS